MEFTFKSFDMKYQKVLETKAYYAKFNDEYMEYLHHLQCEVPIEFEKDYDGELEMDEDKSPIVKEWKAERFFTDLLIKRSNMGEIRHEWLADEKCHEVTISTISGTQLAIPFKNKTECQEFFSYLKQWTLGTLTKSLKSSSE